MLWHDAKKDGQWCGGWISDYVERVIRMCTEIVVSEGDLTVVFLAITLKHTCLEPVGCTYPYHDHQTDPGHEQ